MPASTYAAPPCPDCRSQKCRCLPAPAPRRKPRVTVRCVANHYAAPAERIVEFSFPDTPGPLGGLISFYAHGDGNCTVNLFRVDRAVRVRVCKERKS